ncbi:hypothetical protein DH2020_010298 [Rehmannia glutinosa]|uniref:Uncharacterized protein n=1 Tax=Rehmannia glutinosa TaxID=99300 RepID=A0ABR0XA94_REHGL
MRKLIKGCTHALFMGKSIPSPQKLQQFVRVIASPDNGSRRPSQLKPVSKTRPLSSPDPTGCKPDSHQLRISTRRMEAAENSERRRRMPLADVVSDCVQRWFQDTLKEAKNGDISMQVLVGQMYYSGYGVTKDLQKMKMGMHMSYHLVDAAKETKDAYTVTQFCSKH